MMSKDTPLDAFPEDIHMSIPYRPGVGIMLLNAKKEVFVAQRLDMRSDAWQMPQGGINIGEAPRDAAFRELEEETCVTKASILRESDDWFFYDFPEELAQRLWGGKFRGQRQKWFAMQFEGEEKTINLCTKNPEFSEWKWVKHTDVPELIVPFKRTLYQKVLAQFADLF